jgi:hypothetical protein
MPGVELKSKKHNVLSITYLPFHHILYIPMRIIRLTTKIDMDYSKSRQCYQVCK